MDDLRILLLRPTEAAETLGISRAKLYELLSAGEIRSVRIGRSRRIPTRVLEEYARGLEQEDDGEA